MDAYVALGSANYIIGCLPTYKRFIIRFGGFHGDRVLGMRQLALSAKSGHYLRPYAKLTLGLAAMREKQPDLARTALRRRDDYACRRLLPRNNGGNRRGLGREQ